MTENVQIFPHVVKRIAFMWLVVGRPSASDDDAWLYTAKGSK
jgi:hypothetical protein